MARVKAVAEGDHTITRFLNVDGAREALDVDEKAFGAEERLVVSACPLP